MVVIVLVKWFAEFRVVAGDGDVSGLFESGEVFAARRVLFFGLVRVVFFVQYGRLRPAGDAVFGGDQVVALAIGEEDAHFAVASEGADGFAAAVRAVVEAGIAINDGGMQADVAVGGVVGFFWYGVSEQAGISMGGTSSEGEKEDGVVFHGLLRGGLWVGVFDFGSVPGCHRPGVAGKAPAEAAAAEFAGCRVVVVEFARVGFVQGFQVAADQAVEVAVVVLSLPAGAFAEVVFVVQRVEGEGGDLVVFVALDAGACRVVVWVKAGAQDEVIGIVCGDAARGLLWRDDGFDDGVGFGRKYGGVAVARRDQRTWGVASLLEGVHLLQGCARASG